MDNWLLYTPDAGNVNAVQKNNLDTVGTPFMASAIHRLGPGTINRGRHKWGPYRIRVRNNYLKGINGSSWRQMVLWFVKITSHRQGLSRHTISFNHNLLLHSISQLLCRILNGNQPRLMSAVPDDIQPVSITMTLRL